MKGDFLNLWCISKIEASQSFDMTYSYCMSWRKRVHSKWKEITIFGDEGDPCRCYQVDSTGRLITKLKRQKRRQLLQLMKISEGGKKIESIFTLNTSSNANNQGIETSNSDSIMFFEDFQEYNYLNLASLEGSELIFSDYDPNILIFSDQEDNTMLKTELDESFNIIETSSFKT